MNLPNRISLARIIMTPIMLILFLLDGVIPYHVGALAAVVVFLVAAATDGIDGHIARSRNMVTTLGKFLDSIADKVLCVVAFVLIVYAVPAFPQWSSARALVAALVAIQVARDFMISALRQIAAANNFILAADMWGKVKAVCTYIAVPLLMAAPAISDLADIDGIYLYAVGFAFLALATLLSIVSAVHYLVKNKAVLQCE